MSQEELESLKELLRNRYAAGDGSKPSVQKELAFEERRAWTLQKLYLQERGDNLPRKEKWFESLGVNAQITAMVRSNLLSAGEWVDSLWLKVHDGKMPIRVAYKLALRAKKLAKDNGLEQDVALTNVLESYYADTYEARSPKGGTTRRKMPRPREDQPLDYIDPDTWDPDVENSRKFRSLLNTLTTAFVDHRLEELDESVKRDLVRDFEFEVRVTYEDLLRKISGFRKELGMTGMDTITFSTAKQACEVLGVEPPKKSEQVDAITARRAHRKLASQFHPDRNGGSEKLVAQYQAVNEAWEVIQQYNEQLEG
jgi:hypothetical protein